jgi:hypothetical protein
MKGQAPTYRPTWVLVLTSVMLLAGGYSLIAGMLKLRDPVVVLTVGTNDAAGSNAELQLNQQLAAVRLATVGPHRTMVRVEAAFEILLSIYTLYATAAVLSRDRRGRTLTLGVGIFGIVYQVATLPVYLSLMSDYATRGADLLAQVVVQSAGGATAPSVPEVAQRLRSAIVGGPIVVTIISVLGALVLLRFFGGPRGKALYGIGGPPSTRPGA